MDPHEHDRLADFEEWYWWHRGRLAIVRRVLRHYAPPGARLLDVGCGTGATTLALAGNGRVVGMDVGAHALRHARLRGLAVVQASAAQLPARPGAFDVAVALDVLEHLDDDVGAAREILGALRPGGLLLATVPAYPFLWSAHDEALGHRRRYRRPELLSVLERAGFESLLCTYVMGSILPAAMAVRLWERWVRRAPAARESGYVVLPAALNALLTWITSAGSWLLPHVRLPFGLSLLAVARRPAGPSESQAQRAR
jgi:SAM-dependent methyltransferase